MLHDTFFWLLLMLIAPVVAIVFVPSVTLLLSDALRNHACGMLSLYPALRRSFSMYRLASSRGIVDDPELITLKDLLDLGGGKIQLNAKVDTSGWRETKCSK